MAASGATARVRDISPGSQGSYPGAFTVAERKFFFTACDPGRGCELWSSDGTAAGTRLVKDITPGSDGTYPQELTVVGNLLYLSVDHALWKSDGTGRGTAMVTDSLGNPVIATELENIAGALYFFSGIWRNELWRSDGSPEGTVLVKMLPRASHSTAPFGMRDAGGMAFFAYGDGIHGPEPWGSDGTAAGTRMLEDIRPGPVGSIRWRRSEMEVVGSRLYFDANEEIHGWELWAVDGGP